jgi:hypothetical protein
MSFFPGTYIPTGKSSSERMNHLVDDLLTPRLMSFRQVCFYDEQATLDSDGETWRSLFGNWLEGSPIKFRKNGSPYNQVTDIDYSHGTFKAGIADVGLDGRPRDTIFVDYYWDYFPIEILEGFYKVSISLINMTAVGPPTNYNVNNAPPNWAGVMTDMTFAMCMEKLLLDYDLWKYRLVFAIGPNDVYQGGGDVVSQLETLKNNAEERANRAMENEKFKTGNYLSPPTGVYYNAIRGMGGTVSRHGIPFLTGRLRGWKPNRAF